jgi:hypothetical protein
MAQLTTSGAVKRYLSIKDSNQDALIATLIARESRLIERWTGRVFSPSTWTAKRLNGTGTGVLTLPEQPVISVASVLDGLTPIQASADGVSSGYVFDTQRLYLTCGLRFTAGRQNVTATWSTGYQGCQTDEIPTTGAPILEPDDGGSPCSPIAVVDATTGTAFTLVSGTPAAGQYAFIDGQFTFAAADAGRSVTMTYYCIPGPVAQACIEMVGNDLKSRDNIGINSKTLAGETISYSSKGMNDSVLEQLRPYRRMVVA